LPIGLTAAVLFDRRGDALLTYNGKGLLRWPLRADAAEPGLVRLGPPTSLGHRPGHSGGYNWAARGRGRQVALTDWERNRALLFDVDSPDKATTLPCPGARSVALSPDGRWAALGTWGNDRLVVYDLRTGRRAWQFNTGSGPAHAAFSPDGRWL